MQLTRDGWEEAYYAVSHHGITISGWVCQQRAGIEVSNEAWRRGMKGRMGTDSDSWRGFHDPVHTSVGHLVLWRNSVSVAHHDRSAMSTLHIENLVRDLFERR